MVLLIHPDGAPTGVYVPRPVRWTDRAAARLHASRLDAQLAAGADPDSSALLGLRAQALTSPRRRRLLGRALERVAARGPVAAPQLLALAARLLRPRPLAIRGIAAVQVLLTDGAGPLHRHGEDLAATLAGIEAALEL
jgi:hypothetical protein